MNDSLYEDYMRSVLGYQGMNSYPNTYNMNYDNYERYDSYVVPTMSSIASNQTMTAMSNIQMQELENCYPDIYRIIYPMVQRACTQNTRQITREVIETMTDEIYFAIDDNEITQSRGNESKDIKESKNVTVSNKKIEESENRQRVVNNPALRDLITILLLRELIGRPGFPGRPPIGPRPPRPPMRPRPPRPPMRPPMRPQSRGDMESSYNNREYFASLDDGYSLYEY